MSGILDFEIEDSNCEAEEFGSAMWRKRHVHTGGARSEESLEHVKVAEFHLRDYHGRYIDV